MPRVPVLEADDKEFILLEITPVNKAELSQQRESILDLNVLGQGPIIRSLLKLAPQDKPVFVATLRHQIQSHITVLSLCLCPLDA